MRIEPHRLAERSDRLGVIEAEREIDPLVEQVLGHPVVRADLVVMGAEALEHRRAGLVGGAHVHAGHGVDHLHHAAGRHRHVGGHGIGRQSSGGGDCRRDKQHDQRLHGFLPNFGQNARPRLPRQDGGKTSAGPGIMERR
jgi:hypothetical protein